MGKKREKEDLFVIAIAVFIIDAQAQYKDNQNRINHSIADRT